VLAWVGVLTGIMVNTFFHRNCFGYVNLMDLTDPCQSVFDWGLFFAAAVGAGMTILDERVGYVGFILVHVLASILFFTFIVGPVFLGLTGPQASVEIVNRALVIDFRSQFPLPIFFSLIGSFLGVYLGGWVK